MCKRKIVNVGPPGTVAHMAVTQVLMPAALMPPVRN